MKVSVLIRTIALICSVAFVVNVASAQEKTRRVPALTEQGSKKIARANEYLNPEEEGVEPNYQEGLKELGKISTKGLNAFELAVVYQMFGFAHYSLENMDEAIKYYKLVVAQSPNISAGLEQTTYKTIAQLYLMTENYQQAIDTYKQYMSMAKIVGAEDYFLLGQAYYQINELNNSLENVDLAVKMIEDSGRVPKEQWFDLQRGLYYEKEDYAKVTQIIEKMIVHYNKGKYWHQLGGMYGVSDKSQEQLQSYNAAYLMGELQKEKDLLNLVYLNFDAEFPYKAAKILQKGMSDGVIEKTSKNLQTLGTALRMSQEIEDSIPIIEEAAGKSNDGNLYADLAMTYYQSDAFDKSIDAAEKAIKRKGLRSPGRLHITLGMSQFYLKKYDDAIQSFREAAKNKGSERTAREWIRFSESEKQRQAKLNDA